MEAALGLDLNALLNQLAATQQEKSAAKLSERNVVELIIKLRQLGILSEGELLHTVNGKEYLTVDRLRSEISSALRQAGGRLALVELPAIVGVDLVHCERQAAAIVAESGGSVLEVNGELITAQYFDVIAAEIDDQLQESGQLSVGELAAQYGLATELVLNIVSQRVGKPDGINGRLEGGLLYTQAYLRSIKAQLRGALRATVSPALLAGLIREAGLEAGGAGAGGGGGLAGLGGGGVISTLVEELVAEGSLRGTLKGGGTGWTPAVYGEVQAEAVANFYSQNGWVAYDTVKRMGISNTASHLRSAFPDGIPLDSAFVSPALAAALEAAVEDAVTGGGGSGGWVDVGPLLPSVLSAADVAALMQRVGVLRDQERKPAKERKAHVIGGTWVLSAGLVAALQEKADAEARSLAHKALAERKASGAAASASGAGSGSGGAGGGAGAGGKKKGGAAAAVAEDEDDDWSMGGKKGGKGKKGGAGGKGGAAKGGKDAAGGKGSGGAGGGGGMGITAATLAPLVPGWCPDLDWEGDGDGEAKAAEVAALLAAGAVAAYEQTLQAAFTAGAEERRRAKDVLSRAFEESYTRLLLYGQGAEAFADDEATYTTLVRHVLRTAGAECVDLLHRWARVEHVPEGAESAGGATEGAGGAPAAGGPLTAAEVKALLKSVPPDVAEGLTRAAEAPTAPSVREAEAALDAAAAAVGVRAKKLDKKGEKAALAALRERLMAALAAETDPPAALAVMVPLAHLRVAGKAVSLPGKALCAVLARLQQQVDEESEMGVAVRGLVALHEGVVEYLKAQGGGGAAATAALLERLSGQLPALKASLGVQVPGGAQE